MNAPIKPDQAKYAGCEGEAGIMQFGIIIAKAVTISGTVTTSLPANQNLRDVLVVMGV